MAYTRKTLADLQQGVADRHDGGVLPTSSTTLAFYTRLLNRGVEYCTDRLHLRKETSLTTASGTIALPDDFLLIDRVFIDDQEYTQISQDEKGLQEQDYVFWITGNHTDGFYLNSYYDDTFTVKYSFKPAPLVNTTDKCIIPDPEAVVAFAYGMLRKSETDPVEDADKSLQECDSRLNELLSINSKNNAFTGFSIE
jgi:hypothetical protein